MHQLLFDRSEGEADFTVLKIPLKCPAIYAVISFLNMIATVDLTLHKTQHYSRCIQ